MTPFPPTPAWTPAFAASAALAATAPLGRGAVPGALRAALAIAITPALAAGGHTAHPSPPSLADVLLSALRGAAAGVCASALVSSARAAGSVIDACAAASPLPVAPAEVSSTGPFARLYDLAAAGAFLHVAAFDRLAALAAPEVVHGHASLPTIAEAAALASASFRAGVGLALPALFAQCVGAVISGVVARVAAGANALTLAPPITLGLVLITTISGSAAFGSQLQSLASAALRAAAVGLR